MLCSRIHQRSNACTVPPTTAAKLALSSHRQTAEFMKPQGVELLHVLYTTYSSVVVRLHGEWLALLYSFLPPGLVREDLLDDDTLHKLSLDPVAGARVPMMSTAARFCEEIHPELVDFRSGCSVACRSLYLRRREHHRYVIHSRLPTMNFLACRTPCAPFL